MFGGRILQQDTDRCHARRCSEPEKHRPRGIQRYCTDPTSDQRGGGGRGTIMRSVVPGDCVRPHQSWLWRHDRCKKQVLQRGRRRSSCCAFRCCCAMMLRAALSAQTTPLGHGGSVSWRRSRTRGAMITPVFPSNDKPCVFVFCFVLVRMHHTVSAAAAAAVVRIMVAAY